MQTKPRIRAVYSNKFKGYLLEWSVKEGEMMKSNDFFFCERVCKSLSDGRSVRPRDVAKYLRLQLQVHAKRIGRRSKQASSILVRLETATEAAQASLEAFRKEQS
jgi:hypothetical protein